MAGVIYDKYVIQTRRLYWTARVHAVRAHFMTLKFFHARHVINGDRCLKCQPVLQYYAVVTMRNYDLNSIRRLFDGRSTIYQRSLRLQWCKPLAAVTLTYLFI